jgi:outer membrane protein OmpA-like peptidoglycan-associated protein
MRKSVLICSLFALTLAVAPACATKKFVRTEVGQVNDKVASLGSSLEQTQERVRQNEGKITEVDARAAAAQNAADQARQSAIAAGETANQVGTRADARAEKIEAETRKFKFAQTELPDEAKAAIDQMVNGIKTQKAAVWIEIEGHTDNVGDKKYNEQLGLTRAEAVKRYLYEQHQVPLHKMNVISYGEDRPAAENKTRDGRAQNRRVVVKVLA